MQINLQNLKSRSKPAFFKVQAGLHEPLERTYLVYSKIRYRLLYRFYNVAEFKVMDHDCIF